MSPPRAHKTWAQAVSEPTTPTDPQSHISVLETIKSILAMFDIQKLYQILCSLVLQFQTTFDTPSKIMVVLNVFQVQSNPQSLGSSVEY